MAFSLVTASGDRALVMVCWLLCCSDLVAEHGLQEWASVTVVHRLSCPTAQWDLPEAAIELGSSVSPGRLTNWTIREAPTVAEGQ